MGRDATKAAGNPWYQARKKAAEYDDRLPEHIMSAKDCAYIFDVCAAGRVEDAREMLGRFVMAHVAK